jgi:thymidylate synthase
MRQYLDLLRTIKENGDDHSDRTGVGTKSIFGYQMRFNLADGFPLMTTKRLPFKVIAEELFWFLSGSTNEKDLSSRLDAKGNPITIWRAWATKEQCAKFGREEGDLGPIYGKLWTDFEGVNQIKTLCDDLRNNPRSRRMILTGWHPALCNEVALPPCHTISMLKWHETTNRLDLHLFQRSADVFLGVPFNIASYALLLHLLAHTHGMIPGEFIHTFGDVHIYNTHPDQVDEQLSREPRKLPRLTVSERLFDTGFNGLMDANWGDLYLSDYNPMPTIKAEVAV